MGPNLSSRGVAILARAAGFLMESKPLTTNTEASIGRAILRIIGSSGQKGPFGVWVLP